MAITYGNVDNWLKKSNVKGFALTAYPTPGKPYTFNLKHTVVGNRADVYQTKLVSDIVPQLPGGAPGSGGHSHVQQEIACSRRKGPHDRLVRRSRRGLSRPIVTANESKGCVSSPVPCVCHRTYQTARVLLQRRAPAYDVRRIGERCRDQRRRDSERQCEGYKRGRPPRRDR